MTPDQSHGWVIPRPDGQRAPCGGPMVCPDCRREQGIFTTMDRVLVAEGFKIQSGDRILLMAPPNMPADFASKVLSNLKARFTDVEFTMIQGFTGVQIKERDDAAQ